MASPHFLFQPAPDWQTASLQARETNRLQTRSSEREFGGLKASANFQQLLFAPAILPAGGGGANVLHDLGFDRRGSVFPFAANVSQHVGDLVVIETSERRHFQL